MILLYLEFLKKFLIKIINKKLPVIVEENEEMLLKMNFFFQYYYYYYLIIQEFSQTFSIEVHYKIEKSENFH